MHDTSIIIFESEIGHLGAGILVKVMFLSCFYIFKVNVDIRVSVSRALLMEESNCMEELVLNDSFVHAAVAQIHLLAFSFDIADIRKATGSIVGDTDVIALFISSLNEPQASGLFDFSQCAYYQVPVPGSFKIDV